MNQDQIGRLAILVVYYLRDEDLPLLPIHLGRIARHTAVPYTIFASARRCPESAREELRSRPEVQLLDLPATDARGSREHATYLDQLLDAALADRSITHVCTLDVDSFPISDDWIEHLVSLSPPASGLAGVLRMENGDTALPHPSCVFARREFFDRYRPSFSPDAEPTPEYRRFVRSTGQAADTGIHLGSILWNERLPWGHLLRSNVNNPHYLMAGIYGDVVFHLGGVGRGKLFRQDLMRARSHRSIRRLGRLNVGSRALGVVKKRVLSKARTAVAAEVASHNRAVNARLRDWLFGEPDALFAYLRGEQVTDAVLARAAEFAPFDPMAEERS